MLKAFIIQGTHQLPIKWDYKKPYFLERLIYDCPYQNLFMCFSKLLHSLLNIGLDQKLIHHHDFQALIPNKYTKKECKTILDSA